MSATRWIAIATLSCLALAAAYLPPQPHPEPYGRRFGTTPDQARLNVVNTAYERTADLIAQLRFRDSLSAALRRAGSQRPEVELHIRGALPEVSRRELNVAVDHVWRRLPAAAGARLLVILDAEDAGPRLYSSPQYILPSALDGHTCAVSLTLDWNVAWLRRPHGVRGTNLQEWLVEALGPCLYYGAFGQPGPGVAAWLEHRSYKLANTADWDAPQPTFDVPDNPRALDVLLSDMSFDALACTDGRVARCDSAVKHPRNEGGFARWGVPSVPGIVRRSVWPRNFPVEDHYFAALVREMGPDRFARFWRSSAPVDSAFLSAFEQPIEQWTSKWSRAFVPDLPPLGPAPRPVAVALGLVLAAIAVAAAALYVTRRRVG